MPPNFGLAAQREDCRIPLSSRRQVCSWKEGSIFTEQPKNTHTLLFVLSFLPFHMNDAFVSLMVSATLHLEIWKKKNGELKGTVEEGEIDREGRSEC